MRLGSFGGCKLPKLHPPNIMDAHDYLREGQRKASSKDLDGAIADFNQAIDKDRTDAYAYNNRGIVKLKDNDWAAALDDLDRANDFRCVKMRFMEPGKLGKHAFCESFNGRFRDECLSINGSNCWQACSTRPRLTRYMVPIRSSFRWPGSWLEDSGVLGDGGCPCCK